MDFLEKDLEQIIYDAFINKQHDLLEERGLDIETQPYLVKRQLKIGNYGIADIVTLNRSMDVKYNAKDDSYIHFHSLIITVYELKKDEVKLDTLIQAVRYAKGIRTYLKKYVNMDVRLNIVLIGKKVHKSSDWIYLFDIFNLSEVQLYEYDYELDGLYFDDISLSDYNLIDSGFKNNES